MTCTECAVVMLVGVILMHFVILKDSLSQLLSCLYCAVQLLNFLLAMMPVMKIYYEGSSKSGTQNRHPIPTRHINILPTTAKALGNCIQVINT